MEWVTLSNSNKKALLLIMKRAMIPIQFSSAHIVTMNVDSFVAVSITKDDTNFLLLIIINILNNIRHIHVFLQLLKMSYSIFNLLHQTQEK